MVSARVKRCISTVTILLPRSVYESIIVYKMHLFYLSSRVQGYVLLEISNFATCKQGKGQYYV